MLTDLTFLEVGVCTKTIRLQMVKIRIGCWRANSSNPKSRSKTTPSRWHSYGQFVYDKIDAVSGGRHVLHGQHRLLHVHDNQPGPNLIHLMDPELKTADAVLIHRHPLYHDQLRRYILLHIPGTAVVLTPGSHRVVENNPAVFRYRAVCDGGHRHGKYRVSDYLICSEALINSYILNLTISK